MTVGGWIVMILSVCSTTGLFFWCLLKVFSKPGSTEHMQGVLDIEVDIENNDPD